jgi:glycerol uptake facilitator protein
MTMKNYIMESLGVFALCYIGGMSILNNTGNEGANVAVAHMLALGIMIYVGAATSGSHFNPAVSLALLFTKNVGCIDCIFYCLFQFLGGFFGAFLIWGIYAESDEAAKLNKEKGEPYCSSYPHIAGKSVTETGGQYSARVFQACFAEFFATFFLVFMVFGTALDTTSRTSAYGFCIAGAVGMSALGIGSITGGAMNPMRWLGPYIVSFWGCTRGNQSGWGFLIYGVFTCLGGVSAGILYKVLFWIPKA